MLKTFFRDSAVYGLAKLLTGGLTLLALPIYTHALAPKDYGVVDLLTSLATVAHVTVALEIAQGMGRHVMSPEGEAARERYASTALWWTLASYSIFAAGMMPLAGLISRLLFGNEDNGNVVRVATLVIWSTGLFNIVQNLLRYSRLAPKFAMVSILFTVTNVGVTLVMLLVLHAGLVALFIGQFIAGCTALCLGLYFARASIRLIFDRERAREMLRFSIPLVPSGIGVMLCMYVDRFAVLKLLTVADLGLYGVAFRCSTVVAIVVAGFDAALAPLVYQKHHLPETPAQLARMFRWFLALAAPLLLFLGFFASVIVSIVAPPSYAGASKLVFMLSTSMLVANLYNFSPGLWIAKKTTWVAMISVGSGLLNLILNFVLIPRIGLVGAALGTLLSAITAGLAHFVFGRRFYRVPFEWPRLAAAIALASFAGLLGVFGELGLVARALSWVVFSVTTSGVLLGGADLRLIRDTVLARLKRRAAVVAEEAES